MTETVRNQEHQLHEEISFEIPGSTIEQIVRDFAAEVERSMATITGGRLVGFEASITVDVQTVETFDGSVTSVPRSAQVVCNVVRDLGGAA